MYIEVRIRCTPPPSRRDAEAKGSNPPPATKKICNHGLRGGIIAGLHLIPFDPTERKEWLGRLQLRGSSPSRKCAR